MLKPCDCEKHLSDSSDPPVSSVTKAVSIDREKRPDSILPGFSVLAKSMIGSGMLCLAATCKEFGWTLGLTSAFIAALLTVFSLNLLSSVAMPFYGGTPLSFLKICTSLSPRFRPVVDIAIAAKCLGAAVAYLIFTGDMISKLTETILISHYPGTADPMKSALGLDVTNLNRIVQACVVFCLAPFCYCKAITSTKISNLFGLACMLYITVLAVAKADFNMENTDMWPRDIFAMLEKLPMFIFAFTCHQNLFGVIDDLSTPTVRTMTVISASSTITGLLLFLVVMVFPYGTYGRSVNDNFMRSMLSENTDDMAVIVGCVLASMSVSISYPLQALPMRRSLVALIYRNQTLSPSKEVAVRYALSTLIVLTTLGLGLVYPTGLGPVMALTGLIGGNLICFVMPSWLFIQAVRQNVVSASPVKYSLAVALFIFSLLLYPVCLGSKAYLASQQ